MDIRDLRYFLGVAEELNFTRAAARLNISQPPLSQRIRQLEDELGIKLFHRTKRQVQLTEAGTAFVEQARLVLAQLEHAAQVVIGTAKGETGKLVIGTVTTTDSGFYALLVEFLRAFSRRHPNVRLALRTLPVAQQLEGLRNGRIQVGFITLPAHDDNLIIEEVRQETLALALPEHHKLARMKRVPWRALTAEPLIVPARALAPGYYDSVMTHFQNMGASPNIAHEADGIYTTLALIAAGAGIGFLPTSLQKTQKKGIVFRDMQKPPLRLRMAVAVPRENQPAALRLFLNAVEHVSNRREELPRRAQ